MELSTSGVKFRLFLKSRILSAGHTYSDVADHLGVSLPTVNRILNKEDISLERIIKLAEFLDSNVEELFSEFAKFKGVPFSLTQEQEEHFLFYPRDLYLLILLNTRKNIESVAEKIDWSIKKVKAGMFRLAKKDFIEVQTGDRYRVKAKIPLTASKDGFLVSRFLPIFAKKLFQRFQRRNYEFSQHTESFFSTFEMYLSPKNAKNFKNELNSLLLEYRKRSQIDCDSSYYPECIPYSGLLVLENIDLWNEVTFELQKNQVSKASHLQLNSK